MKEKRVEVVTIVTDVPNAIIVDGKRLKQEMERRENWKVHIFFIGLLLGYFLPKIF